MTPKPLSYKREFQRISRLEYGEPKELAFRLFGTIVGTVIIYLYTGWLWAWIWCASYFLIHGLFLLFIKRRSNSPTFPDLVVVNVAFLALLACYLAMPSAMVMQDDEALQISGFGIMGSLLIFIIRRTEQFRWMVLAEIGVFAAGFVAIAWVVFPRQDSAVAIIGISFAGLSLLFYLAQSVFIARRQRIQADEAAARSAQSQKMEAVGQLAGGVAHDFNNMLTAIIGNLDLYEEVSDPKEQAQFVRNARAAAMRAETVVEQLMHYSKLSDDHPSPRGVNALLYACQDFARHLVPASITVEAKASPVELVVSVDENLALTALMNLINNASEALGGHGRVVLSAEERRTKAPIPARGGAVIAPGIYASVSVSDNGPGIPDEILTRVVDPFFTTKPTGRGAGLGLSMVASLAERNGGGLILESSPEGTVATVMLPVVPQDPAMRRTSQTVAGMMHALPGVSENGPAMPRSLP